jgi:hypothetical protein
MTPSTDLFVRVVYQSGKEDVDHDSSLSDILHQAAQTRTGGMLVFEVEGCGIFTLCIAQFNVPSKNCLESAVEVSHNFIQGSHPQQMCYLFNVECKTAKKKDNPESHSLLVVLARYNTGVAESLAVSVGEQERISQSLRQAKCPKVGERIFDPARKLLSQSVPTRRHLWVFALLILAIILILISCWYLKSEAPLDSLHSWMAYDTSGSIGPKYQLSVTSANASSFTSSSTYLANQWALRVDDQALIPLHILSPWEQQYQEWYQSRYPAIIPLVQNQDYLNETWLASPAADEVMVDDHFHFSHCVLAVKRYIQATETGRHVCGRDIDREHVQHCLDALDWWAFPEGRMGESVPNPTRPLGWRTKVCFN